MTCAFKQTSPWTRCPASQLGWNRVVVISQERWPMLAHASQVLHCVSSRNAMHNEFRNCHRDRAPYVTQHLSSRYWLRSIIACIASRQRQPQSQQKGFRRVSSPQLAEPIERETKKRCQLSTTGLTWGCRFGAFVVQSLACDQKWTSFVRGRGSWRRCRNCPAKQRGPNAFQMKTN